jgi:hypothetical protein
MVPSGAMTSAAASRVRSSATVVVFGVSALAAASGSCADTRFSVGETCLKGEDCLSGICAQQHCVAASSLLDGSASEIDAPGEDASEAAIVDSTAQGLADGSAADVAAETATEAALADVSADTALDSPSEGAADVIADALVDSSTDGGGGG